MQCQLVLCLELMLYPVHGLHVRECTWRHASHEHVDVVPGIAVVLIYDKPSLTARRMVQFTRPKFTCTTVVQVLASHFSAACNTAAPARL
jgi:hypothetical protein